MSKKMRCLSVVVAILLMISMPVYASDSASYSSLFFSSYGVSNDKVSSTVLELTYDIVATRTMDELGVSEIKIQRSSNGSDWTTAHTFSSDTYPWFMDYNTSSHDGVVRCTTLTGYYYRAKITFYAKKAGLGTGEYTATTETVYLS